LLLQKNKNQTELIDSLKEKLDQFEENDNSVKIYIDQLNDLKDLNGKLDNKLCEQTEFSMKLQSDIKDFESKIQENEKVN
jgi:hypothetical protein